MNFVRRSEERPDPSRSGRAGARILATLSLLLLSCALPKAQGQADLSDAAKLGDPLPLRRVVLPPERLTSELQRVKSGVLTRLPLDDFETLVSKAARASQLRRQVPQLVRATYAAEYTGRGLQGIGSWTVQQPAAAPGILPLTSLNLALKKVKIQTGALAILGDIPGQGLGLVLEKPGMQPVYFDWSLGGVPTPSGLHFDLRLPPCVLSTLELKVPEDHVVYLDQGTGLLTGPFDADQPHMRLWHLNLPASGALAFDIRPLAVSSDLPSSLLTKLDTRQEIVPDKVKAEFNFEIEVLHHPIRELTLECDPTLVPYEVSLQNAEVLGWQFVPSSPPGNPKAAPNPATLTLKLREPFQGTLKGPRVRCFAARTLAWSSPYVRVRQAFSRNETLRLVLHPDVQLEHWDPGQFRLVSSKQSKDQSQVLTLLDPRVGSAPSQRPSGLLKSQGWELFCAQQSWWRLGPQGASIASELTFDLRRGSLHELTVKLPQDYKAWHVESVELDPPALLGSWVVAGPVLTVALQKSITPRFPAKLTVKLRTDEIAAASGRTKVLDFPDLAPLEASLRRGTLDIDVDPVFNAGVVQSTQPPAAVTGSSGPTYSFPFREQPVAGKLRLQFNREQVAVSCHATAMLRRDSALVSGRLEVEPFGGVLRYADIVLSGRSGGPLRARLEKATASLGKVERLLVRGGLPNLLAFGTPWPGLTLLQQHSDPLEVWRVHFAPPLTERDTLLLDVPCRRQTEFLWEVPVPLVAAHGDLDGSMDVQTEGVTVNRLDFRNMQKNRAAPPGTITLTYGLTRQQPRLYVQTAPPQIHSVDQGVVDRAKLFSYVAEDGRVFQHLTCRLAAWPDTTFRVTLHENDVQVIAARVDGHWLDRIDTRPGRGASIDVSLPLPANEKNVTIDFFYETPLTWSMWPSWTSLAASWPGLPATPLMRDHRWRLAPGIIPLDQGRWFDLAQPDGKRPSTLALLGQGWQIGKPLLDSWIVSDNASHPGPALLAAEAGLRKKLGKQTTLGEALERLAFEHLKDQAVLIVDAAALQVAGVTPDTALALPTGGGVRPFWENLNLVVVPLADATVLTTSTARAQLENLTHATARQIVEEVRRHGRDYRGALYKVDAYVRAAYAHADPPPGWSGNRPRGLYFGELPAGWTEWIMLPSAHSAEATFIQESDVNGLGLLLALVTLAIVWKARRHLTGPRVFRWFLAWIALWGLAFIWLPGPVDRAALGPLATGLVIGLFTYLFWLTQGPAKIRRHSRSTQTMIRTGSGPSGSGLTGIGLFAGLTLLFAVLLPVRSQNPEPATVFLLPSGQEGNSVATVLVAPELLQRLEDLQRSELNKLSQALLVAAAYQGEIKGTQAYLQANFDLYNFADKAELRLPLKGVDLQEGSFLDGAPVYPVSAGKDGYVLFVAGKGFHRLTLSFTCRWQVSNDFNELRFQLPPLVQNQLTLSVPATWQELQVQQCRGEARVQGDGKKQVLIANLGRQERVQIRWKQELAAVAAASVEVQEAYYWDLRPGVFAITGLYNYNVLKGAVRELQFAIPDGMEIRSVELGPGTPSARILRWRVLGKNVLGKNKSPQLQVDLADPATSKLQLVLGLVPRLALDSGQVLLRLPLPLKATPREGFLAYRLEGWDTTDKTQGLAITRIAPELIVKHWLSAGQSDPGLPTRAFSFRRTPGPALLDVQLQPPLPQVRQEIVCHVVPAHTDVTVKFSVQCPEEEISLLQCTVPKNMTLADVAGPGVHHFSQKDGLVQIWLAQPAKETSITLHGWLKNDASLQANKPGSVHVPVVRLLHARTRQATLQLVAAPSCLLEPSKLTGLGAPFEGKGMTFPILDVANFAAHFSIRPAAVPLQASTLVSTELRGATLFVSAQVRMQHPGGNVRSFTLTLRRWPWDEVTLESTLPVLKSVRERKGDDVSWHVTLAGTQFQPATLVIRARHTLATAGLFSPPDVEVDQAQYRQRHLALLGAALTPVEQRGVVALVRPFAELALWPALVQRVLHDGAAWSINNPDYKLQLQPRATTPAAALHVLSAQHQIFLADDRQWIHQAEFLAQNGTDAELQIVLPRGSMFVAASWGERLVAPVKSDTPNLTLPLPAAPSGRILRVRWRFDVAKELTTRPLFSFPQLVGVETPAYLVHMYLPAHLRPASDLAATRPPAAFLLEQAEAHMKLAALLAETGAGFTRERRDQEIKNAQRAFYGYLQHAFYELLWPVHVQQSTAESRLKEQGYSLKNLNHKLAVQGRYESIRAAAEKSHLPLAPTEPALLSSPVLGLPVLWSPVLATSQEEILSFPSGNDYSLALLASQLLLVAVVALWIFSTLTRLFPLLPVLWPEHLILLALFGVILFGLSPLAVVLFITGAAARLLLLAARLVSLLRRFWRPVAQ